MKQDTIDIIEQGIQATYKGEMGFLDWVKILLGAGIERYYADLVARQVTYYATDGSVYTAKLPHPTAATSGVIFSEEDIKNGLLANQRGEIIYPGFLSCALKAGVVNYTVFLLGKQAHYIGGKGEIYIQHFPQQVKND